MTESTKQKGDLLENIIERLCSGIKNFKVSRNVNIFGKKSKTDRQIDVLIEGQVGPFNVKIVVESKNYAKPVGVEKIESLKSKLEDVSADLGVMICPNGFTDPAKELADFDGIQLFEVYDQSLGNCNLFIPLRYVEPEPKKYSFNIRHRAPGSFSMSQDISKWRFHLDGQVLNAESLSLLAWNKEMIPHEAGEHIANFNALMFSEVDAPNNFQYCEVSISILVVENYYLKLFPASFLKSLSDGKQQFKLMIDAYSKEVDMLKNGWKKFDTLDELNKAADIDNQPDGVRELIVWSHSSYVRLME